MSFPLGQRRLSAARARPHRFNRGQAQGRCPDNRHHIPPSVKPHIPLFPSPKMAVNRRLFPARYKQRQSRCQDNLCKSLINNWLVEQELHVGNSRMKTIAANEPNACPPDIFNLRFNTSGTSLCCCGALPTTCHPVCCLLPRAGAENAQNPSSGFAERRISASSL